MVWNDMVVKRQPEHNLLIWDWYLCLIGQLCCEYIMSLLAVIMAYEHLIIKNVLGKKLHAQYPSGEWNQDKGTPCIPRHCVS